MATVKLQDGKVVFSGGKASCSCCGGCISGSEFSFGGGFIPSGPCVDFLTVQTTAAARSGLYSCTGVVDDQATITWSGGTFFSPGSNPEIGPCFGAHQFSFFATLTKGDIVSCEAGSWGDNYGCSIECCYVSAP